MRKVEVSAPMLVAPWAVEGKAAVRRARVTLLMMRRLLFVLALVLKHTTPACSTSFMFCIAILRAFNQK